MGARLRERRRALAAAPGLADPIGRPGAEAQRYHADRPPPGDLGLEPQRQPVAERERERQQPDGAAAAECIASPAYGRGYLAILECEGTKRPCRGRLGEEVLYRGKARSTYRSYGGSAPAQSALGAAPRFDLIVTEE